MPTAGNEGEEVAVFRGRVLVVDDSDNIRALLRTMLEEASVCVVEAKDGTDGLAQLRKDPGIGLVFLDMHMPDMSGLEVLEQIRGDASLASLPVVVLTGDSSSAAAQARSLGAVGWLAKPVRTDAVLKVARNFLR
jgi:two-component system chemotaxis response regulator CheY